MKALVKLLAEFIAWRWAPAVGMLGASMLYVIIVVGMVPSEIGVPVSNAKFAPKSSTTSGSTLGSTLAAGETSPAAISTSNSETTQASAPAGGTQARNGITDFGRRGFSPRLDRPEPPAPPTPAPPPAQAPPPMPAPGALAAGATPGPISGIFSRLQGALRPGAAAAQALAAQQAQAALPAVQPQPPADAAPPQPAPEQPAPQGAPAQGSLIPPGAEQQPPPAQ